MDVHLTALYTAVVVTAYQVWRLSQQVQDLHERLLEFEQTEAEDDD